MLMLQDILPALMDLHMRAAPQSQKQPSADHRLAHFSKEYMAVVVQDVQTVLNAAGLNPAAQTAASAVLPPLADVKQSPEKLPLADMQFAACNSLTVEGAHPVTAGADLLRVQPAVSAAPKVWLQDRNAPLDSQAAADMAAAESLGEDQATLTDGSAAQDVFLAEHSRANVPAGHCSGHADVAMTEAGLPAEDSSTGNGIIA